jgi:GT2 family glycosyltransferase
MLNVNNPKVLLASPTYYGKDYCFEPWIKNVKSFTYNNFDILLVDNSSDNGKYSNKLSKYADCIKIDKKPNEDNYNLVCRAQNVIREYFLKEGYDYLFILESDQFPPVNVIEYLLSFKKHVVSCQYFIGENFMSRLLEFKIEDFGTIRNTSLKSVDESFMYWDGLTKPKYQTGLGCIFISKWVMKAIKFRIGNRNKEKAHSDVFFHVDLNKLGIKNYVPEKLIIEHHNKSWKNFKFND